MRLPHSALWLLTSSGLASCALVLGLPTVAAAATATATTAGDAANSDVTEIVVTSTLRSQRLQDAPIAVNLLPAVTLSDLGFKQPSDLQFISPSVQISLQGANAIYIRGEGTNSQIAQEQSVGLVLDGVVQGFVDDIGADTSDLDHVEVYRGPQGTQFGKNSSAGVVSFTTKNPKIGEFATDLHLTYGEHNDMADTVVVNVPIDDKMAARLVAGFQNRDGVFPYNPTAGEAGGGREQHSIRGKLLYEATDDLTFLFTGDGRFTREKPNFAQAWAQCAPAQPTTAYVNDYGTHNIPACFGAVTVPGFVASPTNQEIVEPNAFRHTTTGGGALQVTQGWDDYTFTSISSYRFMDRYFLSPGNSGPIARTIGTNAYEGVQVSQEFRVASPDDQPLTYVGGVFLYARDTTVDALASGSFYGQAFFQYPNTPYGRSVQISANGGQTHAHNIDHSYAGFLDGTYHIDDQLQFNAGVRRTHDDVTGSNHTILVPGVYPQVVGGKPLPNASLVIHETGYTYHMGPQYFITPDIQVYGTYSHGYKGPLIDTTVSPLNPIKPEEVDMFEIGIKSAWLDNKLTVNLTAFNEHFDDLQVTVWNINVVPNVFQLGNAAGATSRGVELETTYRPIDDLKLTTNFTYNDAYYTDFATQCWNNLEPIKQATSGVNGCYVHPGQTGLSTNAAGTQMVNTSKFTLSAAATYTHELVDDWMGDVTVSYFWRSSWLSAAMDPNIENPGYGVLNLNAGVTSPDGKYRFAVFARNALNTFFLAGSQGNSGGWTNVLNPEAVRTVGASLDVSF